LRAGRCRSFAAKSAGRRRETRPAQGVERAFAVVFLQNQQTVAGTGKIWLVARGESNRGSTGGVSMPIGQPKPAEAAFFRLPFPV
jgi:hypothetical protein